MSKTILIIIAFLYSAHIFSTDFNILDEDGSLVKACTVHEVIYQVISRDLPCDFNVGHIDVPPTDNHTHVGSAVPNNLVVAHNPDCFDWYPL